MANYSNPARGSSIATPNGQNAKPDLQFAVPDLCNAASISLLVLFGELLVLVMLFAGGPLTWIRLALMSLFVQWVAISSAGVLCWSRRWLAGFGVVTGAVLAFLLVLVVTLVVGVAADRVMVWGEYPVDWNAIFGQMVISGIITALTLRYFYVQQQLRQQEQAELQSRIQALQSRIRPHFLFNSMNIIASLIASDPKTAETVVEDLSELFRASLNDAGNQVQLKDELDLCERYVRIEALRLGERLQLDWQVEPAPAGVKIPLLTVQPLLENAIYHGIQPRPEGGTVAVKVWFTDDYVHIEIINPLPPEADAPSEGNKMAIGNIRSRLHVLYGAQADLTTDVRDEYYVTTLKYPIAAELVGGSG
jgi:two-component system sensor histidine kinase AlgZ